MSLTKKLLCIDYLFRGKEYRLTCFVDESNSLNIELEDKSTSQEWIGSFTSEYIEELTKKTGNFKSFDVFVSMVHTVLTENAGSLSLDIMTYSDLEELRKLKMGSFSKGSSIVNADTNRQNKRYLILTYKTDFDKIHYPLPLSFQGTPDVQKLKSVILDLRQHIYNSSKSNTDYDRFEIPELNKRILQLQNENDHLVSTLEKYKTHFQSNESVEDIKKELKAVRAIVRSLEEELSEEKSKHQRLLLRKNRESKSLTDEMEELKASKRNLSFKVHTLTNELALYKRQRTRHGLTSPRPPVCPSPKSSLDLLASSSKTLSRALKNSRSSPVMFSDPETTRITQSSRQNRYTSLTSRISNSGRRCSSADRYKNGCMSSSKFDPTAYIEQQKIRKREIEEKRKREIRSRINTGNSSDRSRGSSPISYQISKPNNLPRSKLSYLSSSNASSMSDLDERVSRNRPNTRQISPNRHKFGVVSDIKRRPTPLNDTDDVASETDSIKPYPKKAFIKKYSNGCRSDDNSHDGREDSDNQIKLRKKHVRSYVLDSGDDDIGSRLSSHSKPIKKTIHNNTLPLKPAHSKQSNNSQLSYKCQSTDITDIDQRLNALQDFFHKYLHNE